MRVRLQKLLKILIVLCVTGSVFLLSSVFKDLDIRYENIKQNYFHNSIYQLERRANISTIHEHITTETPVPTANDRIKIDYSLNVRGDCPHRIHIRGTNIAGSWQPADEKRQIYVFSAYMEGNKIRIVGAKSMTSSPMYCHIYNRLNQSDASMKIVTASTIGIPEGHGRRYTASHFLCDLPGADRPYAVSLVDRKCREPLNILIVNSYKIDKKRNFTVCTTPLNYRYNRAYELIEWIELNRILGADFFTLYNHSTGPDVDDALNFYAKLGVLEVIPWKLPMGVDTFPKKNIPVEIHYFGQLAASNDCLRRNRNLTKYIVVLDVDEFIIPHTGAVSWTEMMKPLPNNGAYVFCNTFFRKEWNDTATEFDNKDKARKFKLNTLLKLQRETKIFAHNLRSKYMVKPFGVEIMGIHQTWHMAGNQKPYHVSAKDGLVHHYRNWENPFDKVPRIQDQVVLDKFGNVLIQKVESVWKSLKLI